MGSDREEGADVSRAEPPCDNGDDEAPLVVGGTGTGRVPEGGKTGNIRLSEDQQGTETLRERRGIPERKT